MNFGKSHPLTGTRQILSIHNASDLAQLRNPHQGSPKKHSPPFGVTSSQQKIVHRSTSKQQGNKQPLATSQGFPFFRLGGSSQAAVTLLTLLKLLPESPEPRPSKSSFPLGFGRETWLPPIVKIPRRVDTINPPKLIQMLTHYPYSWLNG